MDTLLKAASAAAIPVVRGIEAKDLRLPTPCAEYTVEQLMNHLFLVVVNFQSLAAKGPADFSGTPDYLHGDWQDRFEEETARLVDAWAQPSAMEGVSTGMGLPQEVVAQMALLDLTVHAWDLARATGQEFTPAPGAIEVLGAFVDLMGDQARQMKMFSEPCHVPDEASPMEKLIARTGRDPLASHL
ncbi:TIGR03086 family protein [Rhizocola hellebori]|uniref:TIGR03086 family protein n=1 Tax=Rhizocola hellebori TaxID=1392758 RepID=A0A8J3QKM0_9ACTN|nr:TIGR03086 family metal-binding protein [Rhizocola hellebori]GIH11138.1 TIGR03086 family protein [Rhizocola hellebori]